MSDRSQSKVPIFVFVVGAILLGAAGLLSVLVSAPGPGGRAPTGVIADSGFGAKTESPVNDTSEAQTAAKPSEPASGPANDADPGEPPHTGALAGSSPTAEPAPGGAASVEPEAIPADASATTESMPEAEVAEIRARARAAAEEAPARRPQLNTDANGHWNGAAETADPIVTAATPHAANAGASEASIAEPHAPAAISGAETPAAQDEKADSDTAPAVASPDAPASPPVEAAETPAPDAEAPVETTDKATAPEPTPPPADIADEPDMPAEAPAETAAVLPSSTDPEPVEDAKPEPKVEAATEPSSTTPEPAEERKPEPTPQGETQTAVVAPEAPVAATEPDAEAEGASAEADDAPPLPTPAPKFVEVAPQPMPAKSEAPPPRAAKPEVKPEAVRSRETETAKQTTTRQVQTKPGMRPMTLGFGGGLSKPKPAQPAPHARGTSSRSYGAAVRSAVARHKPRGVGRGRVTVTFSIGPMGALRGVNVARSSGHSQLDRAAVAAVRSAAPFPAPPAGAGQTYSLPIYFH